MSFSYSKKLELKNVLHTWPVTTRSSFPFKLSTLRNFCRKWTTSFTFASLFIAMIESTKQRPTMSDASFLLVNTIIIFLFCWCSSAVRRFWSTQMLNLFAPLFYIKLFAYERLHVQLSTVLDKKRAAVYCIDCSLMSIVHYGHVAFVYYLWSICNYAGWVCDSVQKLRVPLRSVLRGPFVLVMI